MSERTYVPVPSRLQEVTTALVDDEEELRHLQLMSGNQGTSYSGAIKSSYNTLFIDPVFNRLNLI